MVWIRTRLFCVVLFTCGFYLARFKLELYFPENINNPTEIFREFPQANVHHVHPFVLGHIPLAFNSTITGVRPAVQEHWHVPFQSSSITFGQQDNVTIHKFHHGHVAFESSSYTTLFSGSALADAYEDMIRNLMRKPTTDQKFIIFENNESGLGNKLRGLGGLLLIALKEKRIILLGDRMKWYAEFYERGFSNWLLSGGLGRFNMSKDNIMRAAKKSVIPFGSWQRFTRGQAKNDKFWYCNWGSIPHDVHTLSIWDGCFGILPGSGLNRSQFLNPSHEILCTKNVCSVGNDGHIRNLYHITCWQIASLAMVGATNKFAAAIDRVKSSLNWPEYDVWFGLQIRVCVDCGRPGTKQSLIRRSMQCMEERILHHRRMLGNQSKMAVYFATDKASLLPEVVLALKHTGVKVASLSGPRVRFVQTATGGSFEALLSPMIDFHMLGETNSIVVAKFTSFSNMAAARTKRMLYIAKTQHDGASAIKM